MYIMLPRNLSSADGKQEEFSEQLLRVTMCVRFRAENQRKREEVVLRDFYDRIIEEYF